MTAAMFTVCIMIHGIGCQQQADVISRCLISMACCSFPDYELTPSGLQYKDLREGTGASPQIGNTVVIDWAAYTIGYYGRVFEARNKVRDDPVREHMLTNATL